MSIDLSKVRMPRAGMFGPDGSLTPPGHAYLAALEDVAQRVPSLEAALLALQGGTEGDGSLSPDVPRFRATLSATQSILTGGSAQVINFDTLDYDIGGYFDIYNHWWAPPAGYYRVEAQVDFTTSTAGTRTYRCIIHRNTYTPSEVLRTVALTDLQSSVSGGGLDPYAIWQGHIDDGDILRVAATHTDGSNNNVNADNFSTFFQGIQLSAD